MKSKNLLKNRLSASRKNSQNKERVMLILNGIVCAFIPIMFLCLLIFALSSCSTAVTIQNPVEVPEVPEEEIQSLLTNLIDSPVTEYDLMQNLYVYEGLLNIYVDYTDALEGYISNIATEMA